RQIATVLDMYADTWDGFYPPRSSPRWTSLLSDEREMWEIYRCPTDKEGVGGTSDNVEDDLVGRSYFMNGFNDFHLERAHGVGGVGASTNRSMPRFAIDMPSETIVWSEKQSDSAHFYLDILEGDGNDFTELEPSRHGPWLSVYGMADASARTMTYPDPLTPVNLFGVTRWGRESVQ
ncbi:MAG: hypothetical protein KDA28_14315, partial [Phycisphaerales bacterium]|nr:hypothetical protein [Phycisphaerales bacterium]